MTVNHIELLVQVMLLFAICKSASGLTALLYFSIGQPEPTGDFQAGMIFSKFGKFIAERMEKQNNHFLDWVERRVKETEDKYIAPDLITDEIKAQRELELSQYRVSLYKQKPVSIYKLFTCVFCLNVWITAIPLILCFLFGLIDFGFWPINLTAFFLTLGLGYPSLRKIYKE